MNQIKNAIEEAGWYEDRRIDISWMIDEYVRVGFNKPMNSFKISWLNTGISELFLQTTKAFGTNKWSSIFLRIILPDNRFHYF